MTNFNKDCKMTQAPSICPKIDKFRKGVLWDQLLGFQQDSEAGLPAGSSGNSVMLKMLCWECHSCHELWERLHISGCE